MAIRITCRDDHGGVSYIYEDRSGAWRCATLSGTPIGMPGIRDEMGCRFALEDCNSPEDALAIVERYASRYLSGPHKGKTTCTYALWEPRNAPTPVA